MVWLIVFNIASLMLILVAVYDTRKSINSFITYNNYYYKFYESIKDLKGDCYYYFDYITDELNVIKDKIKTLKDNE